MTDGEALLVENILPVGVDAPEKVVAGWNPYRTMFDVVWSGRRHVMMSGSQIDKWGNQNFAFIGDRTRRRARSCSACAARPATRSTTRRRTGSRRTRRATFVPAVDVVSGVGYDRAASLGRAASRFHELGHVVTNLCVLDFETPDHRMRLRSVHPGVTVDDVVAATGFELVIDGDVPESRLPTDDELHWIRDVIDPTGLGEQEVPNRREPHSARRSATCSASTCRSCRPAWAGWRAPASCRATANAGALGHPRVGDDDATTSSTDAIREVKARTDRPFGVNLRADAEDADARVDAADPRRREGRVVRARAERAADQDAEGRRASRVVPSIGARRHAEKVAAWGVDAVIVQGGEGGGHTGSVATTLLLPQVVDAVDIPVIGAGGFFDGRGLVAALAYGAAGVAMGTRFLLTQESTVPDSVKQYYLGAHGRRHCRHRRGSTAFPTVCCAPTSSTSSSRPTRSRRCPARVRNAFAFKKLSGTSWRGDAARGPGHEDARAT